MARQFYAAFACLLGLGIPTLCLVFSSPEAQDKALGRTLTFTERVAYQRTIEEAHWRHRIWQKDNPQSKPPIDAMVASATRKENRRLSAQIAVCRRATGVANHSERASSRDGANGQSLETARRVPRNL